METFPEPRLLAFLRHLTSGFNSLSRTVLNFLAWHFRLQAGVQSAHERCCTGCSCAGSRLQNRLKESPPVLWQGIKIPKWYQAESLNRDGTDFYASLDVWCLYHSLSALFDNLRFRNSNTPAVLYRDTSFRVFHRKKKVRHRELGSLRRFLFSVWDSEIMWGCQALLVRFERGTEKYRQLIFCVRIYGAVLSFELRPVYSWCDLSAM